MTEQVIRQFLIEQFSEEDSEAREKLSASSELLQAGNGELLFLSIPLKMISVAIAENNRQWEERLRKAGIEI